MTYLIFILFISPFIVFLYLVYKIISDQNRFFKDQCKKIEIGDKDIQYYQ